MVLVFCYLVVVVYCVGVCDIGCIIGGVVMYTKRVSDCYVVAGVVGGI